ERGRGRGRNRRDRRHDGMPLRQGQQTVEGGARGGCVVVAPPEGAAPAVARPRIQFAGQIVPTGGERQSHHPAAGWPASASASRSSRTVLSVPEVSRSSIAAGVA